MIITSSHGKMLGRLPAKKDPRVPRLSAIAPNLPAAPDTYTTYVESVKNWILGENDQLGDCTCVCPANAILGWTTIAGKPKILSDSTIVSFYSLVGGYNPLDPNSDNGCMVEDVLASWHAGGIGGDILDGYCSVNPTRHDHIKQAISLLGPVDLGINLPEGWMTSTDWNIQSAGSQIAGGHCVAGVGYTQDGLLVVSWKTVYLMSWDAVDKFVEEIHPLLSRDVMANTGSVTGNVNDVDWTKLGSYMASIRQEG